MTPIGKFLGNVRGIEAVVAAKRAHTTRLVLRPGVKVALVEIRAGRLGHQKVLLATGLTMPCWRWDRQAFGHGCAPAIAAAKSRSVIHAPTSTTSARTQPAAAP
jgi:hypothetical protein